MVIAFMICQYFCSSFSVIIMCHVGMVRSAPEQLKAFLHKNVVSYLHPKFAIQCTNGYLKDTHYFHWQRFMKF